MCARPNSLCLFALNLNISFLEYYYYIFPLAYCNGQPAAIVCVWEKKWGRKTAVDGGGRSFKMKRNGKHIRTTS